MPYVIISKIHAFHYIIPVLSKTPQILMSGEDKIYIAKLYYQFSNHFYIFSYTVKNICLFKRFESRVLSYQYQHSTTPMQDNNRSSQSPDLTLIKITFVLIGLICLWFTILPIIALFTVPSPLFSQGIFQLIEGVGMFALFWFILLSLFSDYTKNHQNMLKFQFRLT